MPEPDFSSATMDCERSTDLLGHAPSADRAVRSRSSRKAPVR
ncbi:hypothetical protein [Streptomyces sp. NPDC001068]